MDTATHPYDPTIGLKDIVKTLRDYWKVIVASSLMFGGLAYIYCVVTPPVYEASALVVGADFLTRQSSSNGSSALSSLASIAGVRSASGQSEERLKTIMLSSLLTERLIHKGKVPDLLGFHPAQFGLLSHVKPALGLPVVHPSLAAQQYMFVAGQQTQVKITAISGTEATKLTYMSNNRARATKFLSLILQQSEVLLKSLANQENVETISGLQQAVTRTGNVEVRSALSHALSDRVLLD